MVMSMPLPPSRRIVTIATRPLEACEPSAVLQLNNSNYNSEQRSKNAESRNDKANLFVIECMA